MQQVKNGDTVNVHYHGKLTDGSTFDSSEGREPLTFTVGTGQVIKGFNDGVLDMKIGDKKTIHIPVHEAYGERREDMVIQYPKTDFPPDMNPVIGLELHMSDDAGNIIPVVIKDIQDEIVFLDANHPLAGQDLIFDLELVSIG